MFIVVTLMLFHALFGFKKLSNDFFFKIKLESSCQEL